MGMAMGQDCELLSEVCGWINAAATKPVWAKMTPNITDITKPAAAALAAGCEGVAAINTIQAGVRCTRIRSNRMSRPPHLGFPLHGRCIDVTVELCEGLDWTTERARFTR